MKLSFKDEKTQKVLFWAGVGLIILLIITVVLISVLKSDKQVSPQPARPTPIIRYITKTETVEVEKLIPVEVEKTITTDIIEEQLHDMGLLITEEYFFNEVTPFESTKTFAWIINANSKLIMSYEGTIEAGIDFTAVSATMDDENKLIRVSLPKAAINLCELDFDSFEVLESGFYCGTCETITMFQR